MNKKTKDTLLLVALVLFWPLILPLGLLFVFLVAMPTGAYMMLRDFHEKLAKERRYQRGDFK